MAATDDAISLREYVDGRIDGLKAAVDERFSADTRAVETAFTAVRETNRIHAEAHNREHQANQIAIAKAEEALTIRLEAMNEFRAQITQERGTYSTKAEVGEIAKRLEELLTRNASDLEAASSKIDDRLKTVERFANNTQAQMGTLRALMVVVLFAITIAGFILGMQR
jgi:hypothetical protein